MDTWQKYAAEFLGTFVLVFGGTTAIVATAGSQAALVAIALAFGLSLLAGLYAFGEVSGGHYNPAVSLGMFLDGRLTTAELVRYWGSQFAGAVVASLVLLIATSKLAVKATATVPGPNGIRSRIVQHLYPYAKPVVLTYMKPRQRFWEGDLAHGGWYRANAGLKRMLVRAGLPARAPS